MHLTCVECAKTHADELGRYRCGCGGLLEVTGDWTWEPKGHGVWRYASLLPTPASADRVTLGEGGTPLVDLPQVAEWVGVARLQGKVEGQNPTGSFKDRGMTAAVTLARDRGARLLLCASTGNTSASLAAYGAHADLPVAVLVPKGRIAAGKMAQARAFGARIVEVDGTFDEALDAARVIAEGGDALLMNSVNPYRLEGQKTLPLEILEALDMQGPDVLSYPYGNGGNVSAGWKALREVRDLGVVDHVPRLLACEAEDRPGTLATAIRIGAAVNAAKAERAIHDSGGARVAVPDAEIVAAQRVLARAGVFVEPASAASVAGLKRAVAEGTVDRGAHVVCVLTGNGLKDPAAAALIGVEPVDATADVAALRRAMGITGEPVKDEEAATA